MAPSSLVTALRRLPPSTINHIQSFLPVSSWITTRQYAALADRSEPPHLVLPPIISNRERPDRFAPLPLSKPRKVRKTLHVDMPLREFADIRVVQDALRTGHVEDAVRLAMGYIDGIARELAELKQKLDAGDVASSTKPFSNVRALREKVYPMLELFLDASDHPKLYARILKTCFETESLDFGRHLAGERHVGHIALLAAAAIRSAGQGWIDNLGMLVELPGSAELGLGFDTYPDHPSRVIAALLGDRRFNRRTGTVQTLFLDEVARAGIQITKKWSFLPWGMIAWRRRRYRHVLALQQRFAAHLQHLRAAQPKRSWTAEEISAIARPYESVLRSWIESQTRESNRGRPLVFFGSLVPSHLSQQLIDTLGSRNRLPTPYITQWMHAERLTQRYDMAKLAWDIFDPSPQPAHIDRWIVAQLDPDYQLKSRPRPDIDAWGEYFSLRRALPRASQSEPSLQEMLRRMYDTAPIASLTTSTLNRVLALFAHASQYDHGRLDPNENLPMLLFLLRQYDYDPAQDFGPAPNARTINLAAAALVNLWRCFGSYFDPVFGLHAARMARKSIQARNKSALLHDEWKMINTAIRDLLPEDEGQGSEFELPLAKPAEPKAVARSDEKRFDVDEVEDLDSLEVAPSTPAHTLLRPIMYLVEQAIKLVLSERHETVKEREAAFQRLMERVYSRIVPPETQGWVQVHGAEDGQAGEWAPLRDDRSGRSGEADDFADGEGYLLNEPEDGDDID